MALVKRCVVRCENIKKDRSIVGCGSGSLPDANAHWTDRCQPPRKLSQRNSVEVRSSQSRWTPYRNDLPLRWPAALPTRQRNATPGKRNATQMRPVRGGTRSGLTCGCGRALHRRHRRLHRGLLVTRPSPRGSRRLQEQRRRLSRAPRVRPRASRRRRSQFKMVSSTAGRASCAPGKGRVKLSRYFSTGRR